MMTKTTKTTRGTTRSTTRTMKPMRTMRTTSRRSSENPTNSRAGPAPPTLYDSLAFPGLGSGGTHAPLNGVWKGATGKVISRMSASAREELRARLRDYLPVSSDGRIVYESFANAHAATDWRGGSPHVRHETSPVHHASRRRGGGVAARGARGAA